MTALRLKWRRRLCERKICRFWSFGSVIIRSIWKFLKPGVVKYSFFSTVKWPCWDKKNSLKICNCSSKSIFESIMTQTHYHTTHNANRNDNTKSVNHVTRLVLLCYENADDMFGFYDHPEICNKTNHDSGTNRRSPT